MIGVTLSRWTMSYFAAALAALVAAELMMVAGFGYPAGPVQAPETLILVHVVAIGWLSLLMCGALFQFVPVLVARPLYSDRLPLPTLACLVAGLSCLLLGFLRLGGYVASDIAFFPCAAVLLGTGFALAVWNLGRTLASVWPLPMPACFVAVGLCSVVATVALGIIFALVLGGFTAAPLFVDLTAAGVPLHALSGLGGWLTFTAMGVSYRLLSMFMLAPEVSGARPRLTFLCGSAALATVVVAGVAAIGVGAGLDAVLAVAAVLGLCALALYGADIRHLYRARRRRTIELNSGVAVIGLISLAGVVLLSVCLAVSGTLTHHAAAVLFLAAFGWLTGLGLGKLYKIVAFLTWLECYGPVLGKAATPRVQDLVVERRARKWFAVYFLAVWAACAALLFEVPLAFRFAAGAMLAATVGILVQLVRTRRLTEVSAAQRLPAGACAPRLLYCSVQHA